MEHFACNALNQRAQIFMQIVRLTLKFRRSLEGLQKGEVDDICIASFFWYIEIPQAMIEFAMYLNSKCFFFFDSINFFNRRYTGTAVEVN